MELVSLALLFSTGTSEHIQKMIQEAITEAIKKYSQKSVNADNQASSDK